MITLYPLFLDNLAQVNNYDQSGLICLLPMNKCPDQFRLEKFQRSAFVDQTADRNNNQEIARAGDPFP